MESLVIFGGLTFILSKISQWKDDKKIHAAQMKQAETQFQEYQRSDEQETSDLIVLNDADSLQEVMQQNEGYLPYVGGIFIFVCSVIVVHIKRYSSPCRDFLNSLHGQQHGTLFSIV